MKRQTLIEYSKVVFVSLLIVLITAVFGVIQFIIEDVYKSESAINMSDFPLTVVIDAGHGGEDGGAVGIGGTAEKDLNLAISRYLEGYFALTGIDVVMTRDSDNMLYKEGQQNRKKFFDLYNRVEICNEYENPLVISIHQNKFPIEKYHGLQVYYSGNHPGSKTFADIVQSKTKRYLQSDNKRSTKLAGKNIFLLNKLTCPAVIVECGFLSNREEEKKLSDSEYQRKIAYVIFSSVLDYINNAAN